MPRPIWKGHISFGLVNVPVTLYPAERRSDLSFRLLDSRNQARIRYERVNEETGEEVPWNEIVKAYEVDDGSYVLLQKEDFERAAAEATKTVEIEGFTDRQAIDYVYYDKPYYLVPGPRGEKGYVLLREALERTGKAGIARVVIRTREHLAALLAEGDALVLALLRFHQELRDPETFDLPRGDVDDYGIQKKEVELAEQLVTSMEVDWRPEEYQDEYREALLEWIRKKAEAGGAVPVTDVEDEEETEGAEVVDMMALLKKSVEASGKKAAKKKSTGQRKKTA